MNKYELIYGILRKNTSDNDTTNLFQPRPLLYIRETNQWFDGLDYFDANSVTVYPVSETSSTKCSGPSLKILGNTVDNCLYEEIEKIPNCTVSILKCKRCGHIEIEWERGNHIDGY